MKRLVLVLITTPLYGMDITPARTEAGDQPLRRTSIVMVNILTRQPSMEDLSKAALALQLNKYSPLISKQILKHLCERLEQDEKEEDHKAYIGELRQMWEKRLEGQGSPQLENYLQGRINESIEAAFKEKDQREKYHTYALDQERWKFRTAIIANAGTAIATATITALIASLFK